MDGINSEMGWGCRVLVWSECATHPNTRPPNVPQLLVCLAMDWARRGPSESSSSLLSANFVVFLCGG